MTKAERRTKPRQSIKRRKSSRQRKRKRETNNPRLSSNSLEHSLPDPRHVREVDRPYLLVLLCVFRTRNPLFKARLVPKMTHRPGFDQPQPWWRHQFSADCTTSTLAARLEPIRQASSPRSRDRCVRKASTHAWARNGTQFRTGEERNSQQDQVIQEPESGTMTQGSSFG